MFFLTYEQIVFFHITFSFVWRYTHLQVAKNVFVVFYSGERAKIKILKICEAFGANRYPFTEDFGKQMQMTEEVCGCT